MAPPHSYIDVKDFASVKDLADYITFLDNNDQAYISYFWWKPHYKVMIRQNTRYSYASEKHSVCEMCKKLHNRDEPASNFVGFKDLVTCRKIPADYWERKNSTNDSVS